MTSANVLQFFRGGLAPNSFTDLINKTGLVKSAGVIIDKRRQDRRKKNREIVETAMSTAADYGVRQLSKGFHPSADPKLLEDNTPNPAFDHAHLPDPPIIPSGGNGVDKCVKKCGKKQAKKAKKAKKKKYKVVL